jgi:branched-subunit amino acid transport protein
MTAITLLTRGFFFLQRAQLPVPAWLLEGLRYAPLAAMVAVVAPEIVMTQGHVITTWKDARLYGAAAATGWFFWRRGMLGTIVAGSAVMLALRLGLGW